MRSNLLIIIVLGVVIAVSAALLYVPAPQAGAARPQDGGGPPAWIKESITSMENELAKKYGEPQRERARQGLRQVAQFWRPGDGDAAAFADFSRANFAGDSATLDTLFGRFQEMLEQLDGHMHEINRVFREQTDLDRGPVLPFDEVFAGYDPSAHVLDDFFQNKLAFVVLLNFPLTTLEERLSKGPGWSRRQWADTRLAERFSKRVPASVNLEIAQAAAESGQYIAEYNIWMHHLLDEKNQRPFPPNLRLLSHWNLRDEIKANYGDASNGHAKQRMIQQVMERIVTQTIPQVVINNPQVDWNPFTNEVKTAAVKDSDFVPAGRSGASNAAEPSTRYAMLLKTFRAAKLADPYSPAAPTLIARRFEEDRQIPEARVKAMLEEVLNSPLVPEVAKLIQSRLGRPLEPFDIWYAGFRPGSKYSEQELDGIVAKRFPTAAAYEKDIPNLLARLGFSPDRAQYLAGAITVDAARGSGHAMGAEMRSEKAHLRTRVEKTGMNYKGFNIAVHEMGHNVEQTFSLRDIDYTLLQGVPNTAFTEALAFVFQGHDLETIGLQAPDPKNEALRTLNDFWGTYEIAGVALVDMAVWHWMYDHPNATPEQLKEATVQIAKDIWNRYFASVFGRKDVLLLGIYSHMIDSFLYLPDYPIGHLIAHQVEEQMKKAGSIGREFERMAKMGNVTPDLWMKNASGENVGTKALLEAARNALARLQQ